MEAALIAQFTVLESTKHTWIVLTIKNSNHVYSCSTFGELRNSIFHQMMVSEISETAGELYVKISSNSKFNASNNNRGWRTRSGVDTDNQYHVIYDVEQISVLSLMEVATGLSEGAQNQFLNE